MDKALTAATFKPYVGKALRLSDDQMLILCAIEAPKAARDKPPGHAPFTLMLRGDRLPTVPEGLHRLTVAEGMTFELYMMPIHTHSVDYQDYQIVFN